MGRYTVIVTGASGSAYGMRAVEQLLVRGHEVALVMTDAGREVTAFELGFELPAENPSAEVLRFLELTGDVSLRVACCRDLFDPLASGSHLSDGTLVAPASMGFCAAVAVGTSTNLPERAADVALKERRPLVMVVRETPLSLIHLRNLTALTEAGATIVPASPAFYHEPTSIDDQVNYVVGKALDVLGVEHDLLRRWGQ